MDHGAYSWPSATQVHLSTCNYVQDVQYFYKHIVFIISTVNMKYKIHVFIISTRYRFYKVTLHYHAHLHVCRCIKDKCMRLCTELGAGKSGLVS